MLFKRLGFFIGVLSVVWMFVQIGYGLLIR